MPCPGRLMWGGRALPASGQGGTVPVPMAVQVWLLCWVGWSWQTPTPPPARLGGSGEEVRAEVLIAEMGGPGCGLVGCFVPSSGRWF